jgi:predicted dehydrogenase
MNHRKKYVLVGVGGRARMFYQAITRDYAKTAELVALCDTNQTRMDYANKVITEELQGQAARTYKADEFDAMIAAEKPDAVIVCSIDRTHHTYIIRAMELGCDVISEKPMTTDAKKCQAILDTAKRTKQKLRVTFNYRYAPVATKVRELLMNDTIGQVNSVHFEWLLDTNHGADYYRRWHRDKRNSGGLMVHKSTHHFDLMNFWLGSEPETVFGMGDLLFYGKENAEQRGVTPMYSRAHGSEAAKQCPFALIMAGNENMESLYLNAEKEDQYYRDQSVFGDGISIEDTMAVMVRYKNSAVMTYSLNTYMPWEGYNLAFNGTKGRIQVRVVETTSYVNAGGAVEEEGAGEFKEIMVCPQFKESYTVAIEEGVGGHGGGDIVMLNDIFGTPHEDIFNRAASHEDGALSILTGIAANKSFATGLPVSIDELVQF